MLQIVYDKVYDNSDEVKGYLVDEQGNILATHVCSSVGWLKHDLVDRRPESEAWNAMGVADPITTDEYEQRTGRVIL